MSLLPFRIRGWQLVGMVLLMLVMVTSLAGQTTASAAPQIGQTGFSSNIACGPLEDWVQAATDPNSASYAVPACGGALTNWSTQGGGATTPIQLEVWRPTANNGVFVLIGLSNVQLVQPNVLNTFDLQPSIAAQA